MRQLEFLGEIRREVLERGWAVASTGRLRKGSGFETLWTAFAGEWDELPADAYLKEGDRYRYRRYGWYVYDPRGGSLALQAGSEYFQSPDVNRYAGGVRRRFAPLRASFVENPLLDDILRSVIACFPVDEAAHPWKVDLHAIRTVGRLDAEGHPAPEGIHRDGLTWITTHLVGRRNVRGGVSIVFSGDDQPLDCCELSAPLDTLFVDDVRMKHAVTPIRPRSDGRPAVRDMMLLGFSPLDRAV